VVISVPVAQQQDVSIFGRFVKLQALIVVDINSLISDSFRDLIQLVGCSLSPGQCAALYK